MELHDGLTSPFLANRVESGLQNTIEEWADSYRSALCGGGGVSKTASATNY